MRRRIAAQREVEASIRLILCEYTENFRYEVLQSLLDELHDGPDDDDSLALTLPKTKSAKAGA